MHRIKIGKTHLPIPWGQNAILRRALETWTRDLKWNSTTQVVKHAQKWCQIHSLKQEYLTTSAVCSVLCDWEKHYCQEFTKTTQFRKYFTNVPTNTFAPRVNFGLKKTQKVSWGCRNGYEKLLYNLPAEQNVCSMSYVASYQSHVDNAVIVTIIRY